jgi:glycosyltransferase involved in cell wall biosynthesis
MRVTKVLHVFSTFNLGGPQSRFLDLAQALGPGFEHQVVAMDSAYGALDYAKSQNVKKVDLPTIKRSFGLNNRALILATIRRLQPDVLVSYNWGAIDWVAHAPKSLKRVHVEEGFSVQEASRQFLRRRLFRKAVFTLRRPTLVAVSQRIAKIARSTWGVSGPRLSFIPNGVDLSRFSDVVAVKAINPFRFGTVAGLRPEKRLDRLIEAFARLSNVDVTLDIAGEGGLRPELEAQIKRLKLGSRVRLLGHLPDPSTFIAGLSCFVLVSETEQAPISLIEAMACAIPCLVTDAGDMPLMLPQENSAWVVGQSEDQIHVGLLSAVRASDSREVGRRNREKATRDFDAKTMVEAWRKLLGDSTRGDQ